MKKFLPTVIVVFIFIMTAETSRSQSMGSGYTTSIGFKYYPGAITVKHFIGENRAVEGLLSFWDHGFRVTGLYEIHGDITDARGLKWYIGPGLHVGAYNEGWYHNDHYFESGSPSFGIDGVAGLDYKSRMHLST